LLLYTSVELLLVLEVILSVALLDVFAIADDILDEPEFILETCTTP